MPLVESLLSFLDPIGRRFNIQNRDNEKFVIPFVTPRFAEHEMKRRGSLNQRASALVETSGLFAQSRRVAVQFLCESHNLIVESVSPIRAFTQPRARGEMLVHLRYASLVAEQRQTEGRKFHRFQTTLDNLERRKFLSDEKHPFALRHRNRNKIGDRL